MPSGKKSKQARRAAAAAPPPVQSKGSPRRRQANPRVLAAAAAVVVLAAVGIGLGVAFAGGGGGSGIPKGTPRIGNCASAGLPGCNDVETLFKGIPQKGLYLGSPFAPAQMVMFIDLQCPYCQQYETTVMPTIIKKYVRTGKVRVKVEPWAFIGPDSVRGQHAMFAAANQNKAWNFAEVLYLNQRTENTGWLNDAMVAQAAASVNGLDVTKVFAQRNSSQVKNEAAAVAAAAHVDKVTGTPTVFVGKNGTKPKVVGTSGTVPDLTQTEAAIQAAQ